MSMTTLLDDLTEKRLQLADDLEAAVAADDFDPDSPTLADTKRQAEALDKRIAAVREAAEKRAAISDFARGLPAGAPAGFGDDIGSIILNSSGYRQWKRNGGSGRQMLMSLPIEHRAPLTTTSFTSTKDRVYAAAPAQRNTLLDALNKIQVASGSVEIVTYPSADPVAGNVPEGTAKPEAPIVPVVLPATLVTQAHWTEATRQIIEDEIRLRDFLTNSLMRGVYDKAEQNAADTITAGTYAPASAPTLIESIRIAIAMVIDAGWRASGILINPLDAATLDYELWAASNGNTGGTGAVWGVPVIPNSAVASGAAYVADFGVAFHHYYRGSADLYVTDSDIALDGTSNFKRNILTFLAEYRSVTCIIRPEACVKASATGTPPLGSTSGSTTSRSAK